MTKMTDAADKMLSLHNLSAAMLLACSGAGRVGLDDRVQENALTEISYRLFEEAERLKDLIDEMRNEGEAMLTSAGTSAGQISYQRFAELRYVGQGHQIKVRIPEGPLDSSMTEKLLAEFESEYKRLYGRTATGNPVEAINWRLVAAAPSPHLPLDQLATGSAAGASEALRSTHGHCPA